VKKLNFDKKQETTLAMSGVTTFGDLPPEIRLEVQHYVVSLGNIRLAFWDRESRALAEIAFRDWTRRVPGRREVAEKLQVQFGQNPVQCYHFMIKSSPVFGQGKAKNWIIDNIVKDGSSTTVVVRGREVILHFCYINRGNDYKIIYQLNGIPVTPPGKFLLVKMRRATTNWSLPVVIIGLWTKEKYRANRYKIPVEKFPEALISWPREWPRNNKCIIVNPYGDKSL
jgi:hypothetical protein